MNYSYLRHNRLGWTAQTPATQSRHENVGPTSCACDIVALLVGGWSSNEATPFIKPGHCIQYQLWRQCGTATAASKVSCEKIVQAEIDVGGLNWRLHPASTLLHLHPASFAPCFLCTLLPLYPLSNIFMGVFAQQAPVGPCDQPSGPHSSFGSCSA
jgi:hypothetical protein